MHIAGQRATHERPGDDSDLQPLQATVRTGQRYGAGLAGRQVARLIASLRGLQVVAEGLHVFVGETAEAAQQRLGLRELLGQRDAVGVPTADTQRLDHQCQPQVGGHRGGRAAARRWRVGGQRGAEGRQGLAPELIAHGWSSTFGQASSTSSMRLEKPHSLSYQASTLTRSPCTRVWLRSATHDSG